MDVDENAEGEKQGKKRGGATDDDGASAMSGQPQRDGVPSSPPPDQCDQESSSTAAHSDTSENDTSDSEAWRARLHTSTTPTLPKMYLLTAENFEGFGRVDLAPKTTALPTLCASVASRGPRGVSATTLLPRPHENTLFTSFFTAVPADHNEATPRQASRLTQGARNRHVESHHNDRSTHHDALYQCYSRTLTTPEDTTTARSTPHTHRFAWRARCDTFAAAASPGRPCTSGTC